MSNEGRRMNRELRRARDRNRDEGSRNGIMGSSEAG